MVTKKTPAEIKILREGGKRLASIVRAVADAVRPGMSTAELDALAERLIAEAGAEPSFKDFEGYPAVSCISVNDQVVHGIPRPDKFVHTGDIVGIDIGLRYEGLFTDMAVSVPVGSVSEQARQLLAVTEESLRRGIKQIRAGRTIGDIGNAVQSYAEAAGFSVVRNLVGHGVGYEVHEEPRVPNFGKPGTGLKLEAGMVLAIEPMVNIGGPAVVTADDGWTISTADGSLSAHFEHTIVVTERGMTILTA